MMPQPSCNASDLLGPETTPVFALRDRCFTVGDIIWAADLRGELAAFWKELLLALEFEERAGEEDREAGAETLQSLSEEFRYQRDLITAEETEAWLGRRRLSPEDFDRYFQLAYWRGKSVEDQPKQRIDFDLAAPDWQRGLVVHLLMSGGFDKLARALSHRAVAFEQADDPLKHELQERVEAEARRRWLARGFDEARIAEWLANAGRDASWLQGAIHAELVYESQCQRLITMENRVHALNLLRFALTRLEVEAIDFGSEQAAREAYLCLRQDGLAMEEVAKIGGSASYQLRLHLGDVAEEAQHFFLSAPVGSVLKPLRRTQGFQLCRIVSKEHPTLDDVQVRHRLDRWILESHFGHQEARHVRWLL